MMDSRFRENDRCFDALRRGVSSLFLAFIFVLWSSCQKIWANDAVQFHTVTHSNFTCEIGLKIFNPPIKTQGYKIINSAASPEWFSTWHIIHRTNEFTYQEFLTLVTPEFVKINNYDRKMFEDVLKSRRVIESNKRSSYKTTFFYEIRVKKDQKEFSVVASISGLFNSMEETSYSVALEIFLKEKEKWLIHDFIPEKDWLLKFPLSDLEKMKLITSKDQKLKLDANEKFESSL